MACSNCAARRVANLKEKRVNQMRCEDDIPEPGDEEDTRG
jgi:hypothetical protein